MFKGMCYAQNANVYDQENDTGTDYRPVHGTARKDRKLKTARLQ